MTNRIPFGAELGATYDGYECHSCGAKRGEYHDGDCDVERCAFCGRQRLTCHCWEARRNEVELEAEDDAPIDEW